MINVPGNGGLLDAVQDLDFMPGFNIEGFPNRDSTIYVNEYNIESAKTVLRGTIRYKVTFPIFMYTSIVNPFYLCHKRMGYSAMQTGICQNVATESAIQKLQT